MASMFKIILTAIIFICTNVKADIANKKLVCTYGADVPLIWGLNFNDNNVDVVRKDSFYVEVFDTKYKESLTEIIIYSSGYVSTHTDVALSTSPFWFKLDRSTLFLENYALHDVSNLARCKIVEDLKKSLDDEWLSIYKNIKKKNKI